MLRFSARRDVKDCIGDNRTAWCWMDPLHRKAVVQGLFRIVLIAVLIFWPAGTFHYWQGWLFLGTFTAS